METAGSDVGFIPYLMKYVILLKLRVSTTWCIQIFEYATILLCIYRDRFSMRKRFIYWFWSQV